MTAYERGFRDAINNTVSSQLYTFMPGYRNGHDAAVAQMARTVNLEERRL